MNHKTLVFIPAYRCEAQVKRVIGQFTPEVQSLIHTVMVVDNISPDNTLDCAINAGKEILTQCQFIAWKNDENYGLGGSHKAAFRYAIDNGFTHLIVLHGDDQATISDLADALTNPETYSIDCLLGARFMKGSQLKGYSKFRTFGNRVYNLLFSIVVGHSVKDLGSGLNMYRLEAFKEFYYKVFPDNLSFNYLMLLASYNKKHDIRYFPISWREEDQVSNVRLFKQARFVLYLLGKYALFRSKFLAEDVREQAFEQYTGQIIYQNTAS